MKYLSSSFLNVHPGYRLWAVVLSSWHVSTPALPWSQRAGRGRTKRCIHLSYQTSPPDQQWVPVCLIMECRVTGCAGRRTPAGNWVDELDLSLFLWSVILPFSKAQCYVCTQYMFEENDRSFPYPFNKVFCWQTLSHFIVSFLQEVHHCRRQIKYSKDKMWYLAKMVRPFSSVSVNHISPIKWGFFSVVRLRLWLVSNRRPQKGLWCICVFPFSFSAFLLFSWLHLIHVAQLCRGTLTLFALLHRSEGWASTRLSHSWSSTTRRGRRSWKRFEAARSPQSQINVLSNSCIIIIFLFSLLLVYSFILLVQVLLEAQEMAVKNHNVEYKSNLYIGKCLQHWGVSL